MELSKFLFMLALWSVRWKNGSGGGEVVGQADALAVCDIAMHSRLGASDDSVDCGQLQWASRRGYDRTRGPALGYYTRPQQSPCRWIIGRLSGYNARMHQAVVQTTCIISNSRELG